MRIAAFAARKDGVLSIAELYALGLTAGGIKVRVRRGGFHSIHRGVYAVGHTALTRRSYERAAVLAAGPRAARSHQTAGAAWAVLRHGGAIHATAPRSRGPHCGFVLHRTRSLHPEDVVILEGIPTTGLHRTLVDLADVLSEKQLTQAIHESEVRRLLDLKQLQAAQARVPGRKGRHRLKRVLDAYTEPAFTREEAENLFKQLCEDFAIPMPQFNATRAGYEIDALWPDARLGIEVDGYATHATRKAFYGDRAKSRALRVQADIEIQRVTWPDLTTGREALARDIVDLLRRR